MITRARFRGSLLGLACGDAVGTTVEFSPPGTFPPVEDMTGGGPFALPPGAWTDDTSLALCLADSLLEKQGFDPIDQLQKYVRWWRHGYRSSTCRCFDIGNATQQALSLFERTGQPWCGDPDPGRGGNGSLMRLAPVALFFANDARQAIQSAGDSSRTTHAAPNAIDACRYFAGLLVGALHGARREELLAPFYAPIPGYWNEHPLAPEIHEVASGSFLRKTPPEIKGSGYVVRSLEAALWAFAHSDSYRSGCLAAVNLGDDADTTAAVYGQLAGAYYGEEGIPPRWRMLLAQYDQIAGLADRLFEAAEKQQSGVG
jgi:ADP-ribosylglycohydrolase